MIELILLALVIWVTAYVVASRKEQESPEDISVQFDTDEVAIRRRIAGQIREKAAVEHDLSRKSAIEETADFVFHGDSYSVDTPSRHYAGRYRAELVSRDQQPSAVVSAQDETLAREQNEAKSINIILYVASLFYGVGLGLHAVVERLRPAAVTFVGTGLALLPFVGLDFYSYILLTLLAIALIGVAIWRFFKSKIFNITVCLIV